MKYSLTKSLLAGLIILLAFTLNQKCGAQDPGKTFDDGVKLYQEEKYMEAIDAWEKIIASGYNSHALYYNLGNACFKSDNIAGAILYYEKALLLRPFNEDIKYNLEVARTYTSDSFEAIPEIFLVRWFRMVSLLLSSNQWALLSLLIFTFSLTLLLIYLFSGTQKIKKSSFMLALLFILLSIGSISLSYQNNIVIRKKRSAIIFSPAVTGKSSPDKGGKDLFVIHEGSKVKIEDELGEWYEIRLSDGNIGWIPKETAEKI